MYGVESVGGPWGVRPNIEGMEGEWLGGGGMHKVGCMKIHPMYVELSWYNIWYMI